MLRVAPVHESDPQVSYHCQAEPLRIKIATTISKVVVRTTHVVTSSSHNTFTFSHANTRICENAVPFT